MQVPRSGKYSTPGEAVDSMWHAMNDLRSGVGRRVSARMGRGDVRTAVLALLHEEPMHGYQIIREIETRTGGRWKPSAGSVYPTLQLLADEGVVKVETAQDRKVYAVTEAGADEAERAAASAPWAQDEDCDASGYGAVPKAGLELAQAAAQVLRLGDPNQQEQAAQAIDEARRRIYSILAQD